MSTVIFQNNNKYLEHNYNLEKDFEDIIRTNTKLIFGSSTIYIDLKTKINTISLGDSIPDGLLFDLTNIDNPEFYLVEIELAKHDFYKHIFPQVTKFFAFYRNSEAQNGLIEKIFSLTQSNNILETEFKHFLKDKEIFKFIKDTIENSQNILIIIDEMKPELLEMTDTYTEWSKMVRTVILKEYRYGTNKILSLSPEFESVGLGEIPSVKIKKEVISKIPPTEEYHLEGADPRVREIYNSIKHSLIEFKSSLKINPRKYYISIIDRRNFVFIYIRKKRINIVVMIPENIVRDSIEHHQIVSLTPKVQKFYGGGCATIVIEDKSHLDEVINLLKSLIK